MKIRKLFLIFLILKYIISMKDKIYEEYGIKVNYLIYKKNQIFFYYNYEKYMIVKTNLYEKDLNELNKIVEYMDNYAVFFHKIVLNRHGYIFEFGHEKLVLLKLRIVKDRMITINEILKVSNIKVNIYGISIIENKIDFFEQYLANYENLDLKNVNYFLGLSENSIQLFNLIANRDRKYVNHKRLHFKETTINFYNPLNIVIDYNTRDLAEYAKSLYINGDNKLIEFLNYINYNDYISYFARLLFPSYYFDLVDEYINNNIEIDEKRISFKANSYEQNLKKLYAFIRARVKIPNIEWLSNVNNF